LFKALLPWQTKSTDTFKRKRADLMPSVLTLAICAIVLFAFLRYYHFAHLEFCISELQAENKRLCDITTALYLDLELADHNAHSLELAEQVFRELRNQPEADEDFANYLVTLEKRVSNDSLRQVQNDLPLTHCKANKDGDYSDSRCPQLKEYKVCCPLFDWEGVNDLD
jgi:hypothetical protein